ncbi:MAG: alpha-2-macroglobulin family protein, partial [Planctomycetota bacterium]
MIGRLSRLTLTVVAVITIAVAGITLWRDRGEHGVIGNVRAAEKGEDDRGLDELWEKVEEAGREDLPKTAVEHLEVIIERATQQEANAELVRAIGMKVRMEGEVEGYKPEEVIVRLEEEIKEAPEETHPLLYVVLAHWYWRYFSTNKHRFLNRTETEQSPGDDIKTWDLPRLFAEIDKNYTRALDAEDRLKRIPVGEYEILMEKGNMPERYRPTLYDFLVAEALKFYCSGEQASALPQDPFVLRPESPVFDPLDDFLAWDIESTDQDSPIYRAARLYQDVLSFHREAGNEDALIDWDLNRLRFGYNQAAGELKEKRYKAALRDFMEQHSEHPVSARAAYRLASRKRDEDELVEAREIADRAREDHPDSRGAAHCERLIAQIEAPGATINAERVWNECGPEIHVDYKNLTELHFKIVRSDWDEYLEEDPERHPETGYSNRREKILDAEPVSQWSEQLEPTDDFHSRETVLAPPEIPEEPGFYHIVAASNPEFEGKTGSVVSYSPFWVSDLAMVMRYGTGGPGIQGMVLDAESGVPLDEARVGGWALAAPGRDKKLEEMDSTRTDESGLFGMEPVEDSWYRQHIVMAERDNDRLPTRRALRGRSRSRYNPTRNRRVVFFTDRSIYRPGQTIHFKGIFIDVNQESNNYDVVTGKDLTVKFRDVNGEAIEKLEVRTNDYGSFSGSFTAPRDRLTGDMSIQVPGHQSTSVRVEEYKRPTFEVSLDAPEETPRLDETVRLTGEARAYTGAPTDGAQVRWRVKRSIRYPWWWSRWYPTPGRGEEQEIAHGTAETGTDGTFDIEFTAIPAPDARKEGNPIFRYEVTADVTDRAGETRSDERTVRAGFTALNAELSGEEWIQQGRPSEIAVRTRSLDGEPASAEGTLKIYSLKTPEEIQRKTLRTGSGRHRRMHYRGRKAESDEGRRGPNTWPLDEVVSEEEFATDEAGKYVSEFELQAGAYRAVLETEDRFGADVSAELPLIVMDPDADHLTIPTPYLFTIRNESVEPGETFEALWGSGYEQARAYVEIRHRDETLQSYWTRPERTQHLITQEVTEELRGGFSVSVTMVRDNRVYFDSRQIDVPWNNKKLDISWERFTSKLKPGQEEKWTAVIEGPDSERAAAEMVAALYDRSLDQFSPHDWTERLGPFYSDHSTFTLGFENVNRTFRRMEGRWAAYPGAPDLRYSSFSEELLAFLQPPRARAAFAGGGESADAAQKAPEEQAARNEEEKDAEDSQEEAEEEKPQVDLEHVEARKDLDETAFFFPHLTADDDGKVRMEFTMPEALTGWKFLGFAHDKKQRAGLLTDEVVTAKDLMVQPNPPRFLREGDVLEFTVRVTNRSAERQKGVVRLSFERARTGEEFNEAMNNVNNEKEFDVPAEQSRAYSWRIEVPDRPGVLIYRAVGSSGELSDGEEDYLPVLSRRIMVTESLPFYIHGPGTKTFRHDKLLESAESDTIEHKALTLQVVSNPAWYGVMALPYLMEFPHECAEQMFNRLYANRLAEHIANSDKKIRRVFDQWKGTDALDSPMEKNQDLKNVILEETPWVQQARSESKARKSVGILFDENRLERETTRVMQRLSELQYGDGGWPWFAGGPKDDYITLYITTGFARLRHLGVEVDMSPAVKALGYLDGWMRERYERIQQKYETPESYVPSPRIAMYLYMRTFFMDGHPIDGAGKEPFDFFVQRAREHWVDVKSRQSQAHLALALNRLGHEETAGAIMRSIKEHSVTDEEMGRYWRDTERSWWWYRAPIETQALMIEAFEEITGDQEVVEECRIWLLNQKRTQDWKTTKATADAIYGLLLRGTDRLASDDLVEVTLGERQVEPEDVEAGTGFYEQRFSGGDVRPEMGEITVEKQDEGMAWGGLHWQYLEDIGNITPHEASPLKVEKEVYTKENTEDGPKLLPVEDSVAVGDELVQRVVLRTDRDMEYVHLKDYRGSGTEPVNVLSRYRYQDGLRYYESTRDTASHFFIDYLP